jgi:hypothetical protein
MPLQTDQQDNRNTRYLFESVYCYRKRSVASDESDGDGEVCANGTSPPPHPPAATVMPLVKNHFGS